MAGLLYLGIGILWAVAAVFLFVGAGVTESSGAWFTLTMGAAPLSYTRASVVAPFIAIAFVVTLFWDKRPRRPIARRMAYFGALVLFVAICSFLGPSAAKLLGADIPAQIAAPYIAIALGSAATRLPLFQKYEAAARSMADKITERIVGAEQAREEREITLVGLLVRLWLWSLATVLAAIALGAVIPADRSYPWGASRLLDVPALYFVALAIGLFGSEMIRRKLRPPRKSNAARRYAVTLIFCFVVAYLGMAVVQTIERAGPIDPFALKSWTGLAPLAVMPAILGLTLTVLEDRLRWGVTVTRPAQIAVITIAFAIAAFLAERASGLLAGGAVHIADLVFAAVAWGGIGTLLGLSKVPDGEED